MSTKIVHHDTYEVRCDNCRNVIADNCRIYRILDMRPHLTGYHRMEYTAKDDYCSFWCASVARSRLVKILRPSDGPLG